MISEQTDIVIPVFPRMELNIGVETGRLHDTKWDGEAERHTQ